MSLLDGDVRSQESSSDGDAEPCNRISKSIWSMSELGSLRARVDVVAARAELRALRHLAEQRETSRHPTAQRARFYTRSL